GLGRPGESVKGLAQSKKPGGHTGLSEIFLRLSKTCKAAQTSFMLSPNHLGLNPSIRLLGSIIISIAVLPCHSLQSAESPVYRGLKPDDFLKQWLILKPIPIIADRKATPNEEAQKKAFAQDWLSETGGETSLQTFAGKKMKIGEQELAW